MKGWIWGIIIFLLVSLVAGGAWIVAPPLPKDRLVAVFTAHTPARQCFNWHRERLNDPDTAYLVAHYLWSRKTQDNANELAERHGYTYRSEEPMLERYDAIVRVEVAGKNSMGAYLRKWMACPLDADGRVDETGTMLEWVRS